MSTDTVVAFINNVGTTRINYELASPDTTRVYVASDNTPGVVSVIDAYTDTIIASIPVGNFPYWLAITPDGSKLYCANQSSNSVSVIDTATNSVISTIPDISTPSAISISPDGSRAYVTNDASPGFVTIIDTATNAIINTVSVSDDPSQMVITPDGSKVYIINANFLVNSINVLHTADNTVTSIPLSQSPIFSLPTTTVMVISPDGATVYVTNPVPRTLTVIDVASDSILVPPIPIVTSNNTIPLGVAISSDGSTVYVASNHEGEFGNLAIVDTASNAVTQSLDLTPLFSTSSAENLMIDPEQNQVVVNNVVGGPFVSIITTESPNQIFTPIVTDDNFLVVFGLALFPPSNGQGTQRNCQFLTQSQISNIIRWNPPNSGEPPSSYFIYKDEALTNLAGIVNAASKLEFRDYIDSCKKLQYTYYVVAEDVLGNVSSPLIITINK